MICKTCGRNTTNENANFCEYCGTSFRENRGFDFNNEAYAVREQQGTITGDKDNNKEISFKNWMGTMLLPCIPFLGIFIYFVMLFVWAFGNDTPSSKRNWARATLVVLVIGIVLFIILIGSTIGDIMNSGLSMEEYMNQYMKEYY